MDKVYINCPKCGKKLFRIDKTSSCENIYVWCKNCKKEYKISRAKSQDK